MCKYTITEDLDHNTKFVYSCYEIEYVEYDKEKKDTCAFISDIEFVWKCMKMGKTALCS